MRPITSVGEANLNITVAVDNRRHESGISWRLFFLDPVDPTHNSLPSDDTRREFRAHK